LAPFGQTNIPQKQLGAEWAAPGARATPIAGCLVAAVAPVVLLASPPRAAPWRKAANHPALNLSWAESRLISGVPRGDRGSASTAACKESKYR